MGDDDSAAESVGVDENGFIRSEAFDNGRWKRVWLLRQWLDAMNLALIMALQ